jgi:OmpA-OmpF porin, OOP family
VVRTYRLLSARVFSRPQAFAAACIALSSLYTGNAAAQQSAFKLDRLEMPGAPDDSVTQFRPTADTRPMFFAQLGMGYSRRPLRTSAIVARGDTLTLNQSSAGVVDNQLAVYANAGFSFLDRFILAAAFPFTPFQDGQNPDYRNSLLSFQGKTTAIDAKGPSAGDLRLDLRGVIARSEDRRTALGAQLNVFLPTGSGNFGGDGSSGLLMMMSGETGVGLFTFVGNLGFHLRPSNSINDPLANPVAGLGVGNEMRYSAGGYMNLRGGKYRFGLSLLGQTGMENSNTTGNTLFTKRNSGLEWHGEGRIRLGASDRMWLGVSAGTALMNAYGSPDFRGVVLFGIQVPIRPSEGEDIDPRIALREKWKKQHSMVDTDHDGIIDEFDVCPTVPEDHLGVNPDDGCPDKPEPPPRVVDTDSDTIPDAEDFCPREPGKRSSEPNRNGCPENISREGSSIRTFKQVQFAFGSAEILPESFPMLQEIADLLKANPNIKLLAVEGHTDNRGSAALNKTLSQNRAASVMKWLTAHAIEAGRLEAHGYGLEKPLVDNDSDENRQKNRRVEFKILKEDTQD